MILLCILIFYAGPHSAGCGPAVCGRWCVVHHVFHLHDVHAARAPRGGVHRVWPPTWLHTGQGLLFQFLSLALFFLVAELV